MERVETKTEGAQIAAHVLIEPAVEQRVDAGRHHRETLQREVGNFEVSAADDVAVQFGD